MRWVEGRGREVRLKKVEKRKRRKRKRQEAEREKGRWMVSTPFWYPTFWHLLLRANER